MNIRILSAVVGVVFLSPGAAFGQAADVDCNRCIDTSDVAANAITTGKMAAESVTKAKLASGAVDSSKIKNGSVRTEDLRDEAVTGAKIRPNSIGSNKIIDNAVGSSEIATNAVGSSEIASNAVGSSEIASNAVGSSEIQNGAVTTDKLAYSVIAAYGTRSSQSDFNLNNGCSTYTSVDITVPTDGIVVVDADVTTFFDGYNGFTELDVFLEVGSTSTCSEPPDSIAAWVQIGNRITSTTREYIPVHLMRTVVVGPGTHRFRISGERFDNDNVTAGIRRGAIRAVFHPGAVLQ